MENPSDWPLVGLNALIHLTALFSDVCFSISAANHFRRGPLGYSCHIVSGILLAVLLWVTIREYSRVKRSEMMIPICNVLVIVAAVWEDRPYDRKRQKQLDVYIRSLRETLREYGIPEILEMEKGVLRVLPDMFLCDAYRFYSGESDAVNAYRGEYMSSYSWASMTEGILSWRSANQT